MVTLTTPRTGQVYKLFDLSSYVYTLSGPLMVAIPSGPLGQTTGEYDPSLFREGSEIRGQHPLVHIEVDGDFVVIDNDYWTKHCHKDDVWTHTDGWSEGWPIGFPLNANEGISLPVGLPNKYYNLIGLTLQGTSYFSFSADGVDARQELSWSVSKNTLRIDSNYQFDVLYSEYFPASSRSELHTNWTYSFSIPLDNTVRPSGAIRVHCIQSGHVTQLKSNGDVDIDKDYSSSSIPSINYWNTTELGILSTDLPKDIFLYGSRLYDIIRTTVDMSTDPSLQNSLWSELAQTAFNGAKIIDNNMWMFLQDVVHLKEDFTNLFDSGVTLGENIKSVSVKDIRDLLQNAYKEGITIAKNVANVYLPLLYGYGLTFDESLELGNKIADFQKKWEVIFDPVEFRARKSIDVTVFGNPSTVLLCYLAKARCKDNLFSRMFVGLTHSGFNMTLLNAWDFVPYSFCVDWIINVGDILSAIDNYAFSFQYDLDIIVKSTKSDDMLVDLSLYSGNPNLVFQKGDCGQLRYYRRWCQSFFDPPPLLPASPLIESGGENLLGHLPEAVSLIVQRLPG